MFDTLSIRLKIVLLSGLCLLGVISLIVGMNLYQSSQNNRLISTSSSRMLTDSGENLLQAKAAEQASNLQRVFGSSLQTISAFADQASHLRDMAAQRGLAATTLREELNQALKTTFDHNPQVLGLWLVYEPNALDGRDAEFANDAARASNENGRFASAWNRGAGQPMNILIPEADLQKTELSISGTPYNSWYTCPRDTGRTCLMAPYADTQAGQVQLMTTLSMPLIVDGKVVGTLGVDLALGALQAAASDAQRALFNGSGRMLIVSDSGVLAAYSSDASQIGKPISAPLAQEGQAVLSALAQKSQSCWPRINRFARSTLSRRSRRRRPGAWSLTCPGRSCWPTR